MHASRRSRLRHAVRGACRVLVGACLVGATAPASWSQGDPAAIEPVWRPATEESATPAHSPQDPETPQVAPEQSSAEAATRGEDAATLRVKEREIEAARERELLEQGAGYPKQMVRLRGRNNVVRTGPGESFAIVGLYEKGQVFRVIAKSKEWYNVGLSDTEAGWIHSSLCKEFDDLSDLELRPNPKLYSRIGTFTVTGYGGGYSFDRKSNSFSLGGRLGYYLLDFLEVEGGVSWSHINRPAEIVESLFDLSLEEEDFHILFYQLGLKLEALPGRRMVPFLVGGVGSTIMQGKTEASFNFGAGTQFFVSKRIATRWELRKYQFESGFDAARRTNHNIEFSFGTTLLF